MPSRKNRNANRQTLPSSVHSVFSSQSLLPQFEVSTSPPKWTQDESILDLDRPPDSPTKEMMGNIEPEVEGMDADRIVEHLLDVEHEFGRVTSHDTPAHSSAPSPARPPILLLSPEDEVMQLNPGHVRSPVLAREPTMLESFSRTLRTYVPSSIHIPASAPSPPLVSRPLSFGNFMSPSTSNATSGTQPSHSDVMHVRGEGVFDDMPGSGIDLLDDEQYGFGNERQDNIKERQLTVYPTVDEGDVVVFSRWDIIKVGSQSHRLLLLGYSPGFQIWDCTNLASVSEILNLSGPTWGTVVYAAVLGYPPSSHSEDVFKDDRPLIGIISRTGDRDAFFVYSLRSHKVVKRIPLRNVVSFVSNNLVTVVSSVNPPTLHILSSSSLAIIYTISASSLSPFHYPNPTFTSTIPSPSTNTSSALLDSRHPHSQPHSRPHSGNYTHDTDYDHYGSSPRQQHAVPRSPSRTRTSPRRSDGLPEGQIYQASPHPIYALSNRLLAFASPAPTSHGHPTNTPTPSTSMSSPSPSPGLPSTPPRTTHHRRTSSSTSTFGITQADIGNAALKVGGSVLSGMKSLGGLAYNAATEYAKSRAGGVSGTGSGQGQGPVHATSGGRQISGARQGGAGGVLFSRSAPAATSGSDLLDVGDITGTSESAGFGVGLNVGASRSKASYVTVLDLVPLLGMSAGKDKDAPKRSPLRVAHFVASKSQPVAHLAFAPDGTTLVVSPRNGHVGRMFQLRLSPAQRKRDEGADVGVADGVWHVYSLRRGRTSAVVEDTKVSLDGRWAGIATRNRTVHIFAINPYGGSPDHRSHVGGRVMNVQELPLSTDVAPLVRLRAIKPLSPDRPPAPLSFTFLAATSALPPSLLPHSEDHRSHSHRPTNFQDVLVFDPSDGVLSLRRVTLEQRPREHALASLGTSISFPATGVSLPGRLGVSPSPPKIMTGKASGLTQMMEATNMELVGKDNIVATWQVRRQQAWGVIKAVVKSEGVAVRSASQDAGPANWLAQAELSTSSRSPRIMPRSVYLAHQFFFRTLGEDYHALIRQYHLDISGSPITVRRAVEISAYTGGSGGVIESESFIDGFTSARHHSLAAPSSFDEPIASAISDGLEHPSRAPIPMLPNGPTGSKPRSYTGSIPIRNMAAGMAEGMSEGFGRFRREVYRVRSPYLGPRSEGSLSAGSSGYGWGGLMASGNVNANVPLEFDEEDEDFIGEEGTSNIAIGERAARDLGRGDGLDAVSRSTSRDDSRSGASVSVSTPSTGADLLDDEHRGDHGLGTDDNFALALGDGNGEEDDLWTGWSAEDKQAVDEAEQFDDVVGFLDEEQTPGVQAERRGMRRR